MLDWFNTLFFLVSGSRTSTGDVCLIHPQPRASDLEPIKMSTHEIVNRSPPVQRKPLWESVCDAWSQTHIWEAASDLAHAARPLSVSDRTRDGTSVVGLVSETRSSPMGLPTAPSTVKWLSKEIGRGCGPLQHQRWKGQSRADDNRQISPWARVALHDLEAEKFACELRGDVELLLHFFSFVKYSDQHW